ncbi:hypothetical protein MRX96_051677 [Rhipicephalus microplus]
MCDFSYYPRDYQSTISLFQKLSRNFTSNCTILELNGYMHQVDHHDLFIIDDVLHRLVDSVRKLACVGEDEALSQIKNSLKSFSDLIDFKRLAGVVKYGVSCHKRDDGQKQLVDIGRDCWLCIRQYLKVGDIQDDQ